MNRMFVFLLPSRSILTPDLRMLSGTMLLALFVLISIPVFAGSMMQDSILISGVYRQYTLFLPSGYPGNAPYPLVINLHARCSNMNEHISYTNMSAVADTAGFIIVYPQGLEDPNDPFNCLDWNDNGRHSWDDVAFISALIDQLIAEHFVSANNVYSCGFSRGGAMCYTLACELSHKISAIAVISGGFSIPPLINSINYSCLAASPKPVLIMHGDNDQDINYNGYPNYWAAVDSVLSFWENKNNCGQGYSVVQIPNTNTSDNSSVTQWIYTDCPLAFFKISGGGHSWPGSQGSILIEIPPKNMDINAGAEIWHFFRPLQVVDISEYYTFPPNSSVYPNPFQSHIHFSNRSSSHELELVSSCGNRIWKGQNIDKVDFSPLPAGMYFLQITSTEKRESIRLIKH